MIIQGVLFAALLVYAAVTDIKRREIDDWVCILILIVSLIGENGSFWGAVTTALPFFAAAIFTDNRMGGGDIKLTAACGAVLGVWGGLIQIIIGLSCAVLYSLVLKRMKGTKLKKMQLPLAPFLCAGGIAAYIITIISRI